MKRTFTLALTLVLTLGLTGCPRYEKVREVSKEQLRVQEGLQANLKAYIKSMEEFAENHIIVSKLYYNDLAAQNKKRVDSKARQELNKLSADKTEERAKISEQLGAQKQAIDDQNEKDKKELEDLLVTLKKKDAELLAAYQAMLDAQIQLNEYIQLKKFDEVLIEQTLGRLKFNQRTTLSLFDEVADLSGKIKAKAPEAGKNAESTSNDQ